jgi:hypothetical protein
MFQDLGGKCPLLFINLYLLPYYASYHDISSYQAPAESPLRQVQQCRKDMLSGYDERMRLQ